MLEIRGRVAEDYATLDHLSGGRFELIIGKGNDPRHYPLFGITEEQQWESLAECYALLKRLWNEENVTAMEVKSDQDSISALFFIDFPYFL